MNSARQAHHADLLPNGKVLISGGSRHQQQCARFRGNLRSGGGYVYADRQHDYRSRESFVRALLYTGQVLVAGGLTGPGTRLVLTPTAELYNPAIGTFTPTGNMSIARGHYAGIVLGDGTDFISGGATLPAGINADIYNPATQTFSVSGNFTAVQAGMREAVAPDGTVLLASGVNNAVPAVTVPNSELFYPAAVARWDRDDDSHHFASGCAERAVHQVLLEHGGVGQVTWVRRHVASRR